MDREFTPEEIALLNLHAQLLRLSDDTSVAGRFIFLGPDGSLVSTGSLSARDIEAATIALTSLNDAKDATEESTAPAPATEIDEQLKKELDDYCIGLDADFLLQLAQEDRNSAVAAFDEMTNQWDGEL